MSIAEKLLTIAENEQAVFNGINTEADLIAEIQNMVDNLPTADGGYDEGYEAGKQAEYDRFWDMFQDYGRRNTYRYAFYSQGTDVWTDESYNPKYNITATKEYGGDSMFQASSITDTKVEIAIGSSAGYTFISCGSLKTIRKLIVSEITTFNRWFDGCHVLENVTFDGVIANNISFKNAVNLTTISVQSIIDHLKDLTGLTSQTLTFHATVGEKLTDEQKAIITAKNWTLAY